jgi:hypothetical protein
MSIAPDTKDWTWVLSAPCSACGFDAQGIAPAGVAAALRRVGPVFGAVLAQGDAAGRRPAPGVWSPLEYACHLRDVARLFDQRLRLMLTSRPPEEPRFADWNQDAAAVDGRYGEQDPVRVAAELADACERLALAFEAVPPQALDRGGIRSDGVRFTVAGLGRYLVHELVHHTHDVTGERAGGVSP